MNTGVKVIKINFASAKDRFEQILLESRQQMPQTALQQWMDYSLTSGGKRLRGVLPLAVAQLNAAVDGGPSIDFYLKMGIAVEMVHAYSLIHDDLPSMDNDDFRRGRPSNHKQFGEAPAILAGDALLTDAFSYLIELQNEYQFSAQQGLQMLKWLSLAAGSQGMVLGQTLDIASVEREEADALEQLKKIHRLKTGELFQCAFRLGTIKLLPQTHEDKSQEQKKLWIDQLAQCFGLLFQIIDDIIDVDSTFAQTGKTPGKDAQLGKTTYTSLLGQQGAAQMAKQEAQKFEKLVQKIAKISTGCESSLLMEIRDIALSKGKLI
jgi:geranylgeranyl diphosphate synthase type II